MARVRNEAGFTLIEMMFVVAIIAVLAALAIPLFTEQSRKGKAEAEVNAWLAEIQVKQEQFKVDNGSYKDTTGPCPSTPTPTGATITCQNTGQAWDGLRIAPPTTTAACTYDIQAGNSTGTNNPGGFAFTSPARSWFYVLATCDEDGAGGTNATFFVSSMDSAIQKLNEGQ